LDLIFEKIPNILDFIVKHANLIDESLNLKPIVALIGDIASMYRAKVKSYITTSNVQNVI